jgi:hypothetical protein
MQNQIINIDSEFCEPNPKGIFTYNFDKKISNVCSIRVSSFEFPNVYYTFTRSRENLSFYLLCNNTKISVNIREGSYTGEQLLAEINNIFQKNNIKYGFQFKITHDEVTSKCTISNSTVMFSAFFENKSVYDCLGKHLGFLNNNYDAILDSTEQRFITGESILNPIGDTYLYIKINNYGIIYTNLYSKTMFCTNLLAKIIIKKNKGIYIYDNESNLLSKYYNFIQPISISELNIELLDLHGNNIDLMGQNFSMTLEINVNLGNINGFR